MQLSDIGRCTAASTARSSADAFCANAVSKAASGIGVTRQHDRPFRTVQAAVEGSHVISERG